MLSLLSFVIQIPTSADVRIGVENTENTRQKIIHIQCNHDQKENRAKKRLQKFSFLLPRKKRRRKKNIYVYCMSIWQAEETQNNGQDSESEGLIGINRKKT